MYKNTDNNWEVRIWELDFSYKFNLGRMGLNYSLGITFDNERNANFCCNGFRNEKINLSDGNSAKLSSSVCEHADNNISVEKLYVVSVAIPGLGNVDRDLTLFNKPNFYTIRDFFSQYLRDLDIDFEFAHFELEAADYLMCAGDMMDDIGFLIGNFSKGDENLQKITGIEKSEFLSKRYIDGIVISAKNYSKLDKAQSEFQPFKENYYWLPLTEFKISN